jgi:hypothetical protein
MYGIDVTNAKCMIHANIMRIVCKNIAYAYLMENAWENGWEVYWIRIPKCLQKEIRNVIYTAWN